MDLTRILQWLLLFQLGYYGNLCQETLSIKPQILNPDENLCHLYPCLGDCKCVKSSIHENGWYCASEEGYIGKYCNIPAPDILCESTEIQVAVAEELYDEYDQGIGNSYIFVSPTSQSYDEQRCKARLQGNHHHLSIDLPFTACGTAVFSHADDYIVFRNNLWIDRHIIGSLLTMPLLLFSFECRYNKDHFMMISYKPTVRPRPEFMVLRKESFKVNFQLCKAIICPPTCPVRYRVEDNGVVFTVRETIHFQISTSKRNKTEGHSTFLLSVNEMFLSCRDKPDQSRVIAIVKDGCPTQSEFVLDISSDDAATSNLACVSYPILKILDCPFFIHTRVTLCEAEFTDVCANRPSVNRCPSQSETSSHAYEEEVNVLGPILLIDGKQGTRFSVVPPSHNDIVNSPLSS
ncbi:uncharacterized protein LOC143470965 [Clavelina lepadiformis]|uniref:ZP domain-containing protein n=1 Tax=Clavelina lepadiformis TaxID=159417 RepID=A0ABP0FGM7_CLALP